MQKTYRYFLIALLGLFLAGWLYVEKKQRTAAKKAESHRQIAEQKAAGLKEQLTEATQRLERHQTMQVALRDLLQKQGQPLPEDYSDDMLLSILNHLLRTKTQEVGSIAAERARVERQLTEMRGSLEQMTQMRLEAEQARDSSKHLLQVYQQQLDSLQGELSRALQHLQNTQLDTLTLLSPKEVPIFFLGKLVNGEPEGFGIGFYKEKGYYIGHWKGNRRHGNGKHCYLNGDVYEGMFVEDIRQGFGRYLFASGELYEGEWHNDLMHGHGRITFKNGSSKSGFWVEGKMKENN